MYRGLLFGQPAEGRGRAGGREYEPDVWMGRSGGAGMKFVVKLGGSALEDNGLLHGCARAIAVLAQDGNQVAVVHGGGAALTRTLKQMGKQSEFIAGLRITDAETRDAALMVLGGRVNKELVAALGGHGQAGVGLSGGDGLIFRARKKRTTPDLGFVGEIVASDTRWLDAIWKMGAVPVISSLALGFDGEYYNINADEMAAACAVACKADALVFLTDVPGVRGPNGEVMRWLTVDQIAGLTQDAVISGGMLPKLGACREALLAGVKRVRILPADAASVLPDLCSTRVLQGTEGMGERYLDLLSGIGVNALGYGHPAVNQAIEQQSRKLVHISNLYFHQGQAELALRLTERTGLDRAFFCNSGTEAWEAAMKLARAHSALKRSEGQVMGTRFLAIDNSFHGRTMGALSTTHKEKYREPFEPLVPGVDFVRFNDVDHLRTSFSSAVCVNLMVVIEGEGGIRPVSQEFIAAARELTKSTGALLVADEIQSGLGRTGKWFAYQQFGIQPDVTTLAKPLAGGLPLG